MPNKESPAQLSDFPCVQCTVPMCLLKASGANGADQNTKYKKQRKMSNFLVKNSVIISKRGI